MVSFREAVRDELDLGAVGGVATVLVALSVLGDLSIGSAIAIPAGLVALATLRAGCASRGYSDAAVGVVVGASGGLVLGYLAVTTVPWLLGGLAAVAAWLCLDSLYDLQRGIDRSSEPDEDLSEDEYYLVSAHGLAVVSELREADRPLSRTELQDRTGLPDEDFERVLETVGDSGPIERVGTGYVLDEGETGTGAMVRSVVRAVSGRLLRPLGLLRPLER